MKQSAKIKELEERIRKLETRPQIIQYPVYQPIYVPIPMRPQHPVYPPIWNPFWSGTAIGCTQYQVEGTAEYAAPRALS